MQRYVGVAIAALLVLGACTSNFAKDHPDVCSEAKLQQVKDAVARGADLQTAAAQAGSDPQCLTVEETKQAQASFVAFQQQTPSPSPTPLATTAEPTSAAPSPSESPSPTETTAATPAPTQAPTTAPTRAPTPAPTAGGGVPGGVPNATGPVPPGFTRYAGTVLDSSTSAPIRGVCVYSGPPAGCPIQGTPRTDANGYFAIDYPAGATFLWTFEHPSYKALISQPIVGGTNATFRLVHK